MIWPAAEEGISHHRELLNRWLGSVLECGGPLAHEGRPDPPPHRGEGVVARDGCPVEAGVEI